MLRLLFAILLLSLSCDGSSNGVRSLAACGSFAPCGGSLVGTWKMTKFCSDIEVMTFADCTMTMDLAGFDPSGTYTFSSDGTYRTQTTVSGRMKIGYSKGCLSDSSMTCDRIGDSNSLNEGITIDCTSTTDGGCQCTETADNATNTEEGTYTMSGTSLTMDASGTSAMDYCVQGNTLKMHSTSPTGNDSNIEITGSSILVLTKQ